MKKFLISSVLILSLSSCSWIFGKDKNELQPKLASSQRTPVNTELQAMQQRYAMEQQPQFIDQQPNALANTAGMMDVSAPAQPQAEVFFNQNVAIGTAPAAVPGYEAPAPAIQDVPAPQPVQIAQPAPAFNYMPQQISNPIDPNAITVGTSKKLPASLRPDYNNPLNYAPAQAAPMPMAMPLTPPPAIPGVPVMQQPMQQMPQQMMMQQQMPMGQPMIQPIYQTTQPVDQMQMYTQPMMPGGGF